MSVDGPQSAVRGRSALAIQSAVTVSGQLSIRTLAASKRSVPVTSQIIFAPRLPSYTVPSRQIASIGSFELKMVLTLGVILALASGLFAYYSRLRPKESPETGAPTVAAL